jgi:hypothetical protein
MAKIICTMFNVVTSSGWWRLDLFHILMPDPDLRILVSEDPDLGPDPDQEAPYLTTFLKPIFASVTRLMIRFLKLCFDTNTVLS